MVTAAILINQAGKPAGSPSVSRDDLDTGTVVTLSNNSNTGVATWSWQLLMKPPGSVAVLSSSTNPTSSFTPDIVGSYIIKLTVTDGGAGTSSDSRIAAVKTSVFGIRIPATEEKTEFDSVYGWSKALYDAFVQIDSSSTTSHALGGEKHTADTLANLNSKVSDADLIATTTSSAGDVSGTFPTLTVGKIQGRTVSSSAPTDGYGLKWNNSTSKWESGKPIPGGTAGGDLSGTYPNPTVDGLQGRSVSSSTPTDGYGLKWNNSTSKWESGKPIPGGTAGGDLSGTYPNPTVSKLLGRSLSTDTPTDGYALTWNASSSKWETHSVAPSGAAGGDLSGTYPNPTVDGLQGNAISVTEPTDGYGLVWNGFSNNWEPQDFGSVNLSEFASLVDAISSIGSEKKELIIAQEISLTNDLTIPKNILLSIKPKGLINITATKTLTFNGGLNAGSYQVFGGDGYVSFASGTSTDVVNVQWFGATGNLITDDTEAIRKAIRSAIIFSGGYYRGRTVFFPLGNYIVTSSIVIENCFGPTLLGDGSSLFWQGGFDPVNPEPLLDVRSCQGFCMRKMGIFADRRLAIGVKLSTKSGGLLVSGKAQFDECGFSGTNDELEIGVYMGDGVDSNNDFHRFYKCSFANYAAYGVQINNTQSTAHRFFDCTFGTTGFKTTTGNMTAWSDILEHPGIFSQRHVGKWIEVAGGWYGGTNLRNRIEEIIDSTHCRLREAARNDLTGTTITYGPQCGIWTITDFFVDGGGGGGHLYADYYAMGGGAQPLTIRNCVTEASRCFFKTGTPGLGPLQKPILIEGVRMSSCSIDPDNPWLLEFGATACGAKVVNCVIGDTGGSPRIWYFCGIYGTIPYGLSRCSFIMENCIIHSTVATSELFYPSKPSTIIACHHLGSPDGELMGNQPWPVGNVTGAVYADFGSGSDISMTATGDLNITIPYAPVGIGTTCRLHVTQGPGGPYAIRFTNTINWRNGIPQALNSPRAHAANKTDVFEFWYDGTNIYGDAIGQMADAYMVQGKYITTANPTDGYAITWDSGTSKFVYDKPIPGGTAGGDLLGTYPNPIVDGLQGRSIAADLPEDGYALTWNNGLSRWESSKPIPGGTAGGDLSGTYPNPTVDGLQGRSVAADLPEDGYVLAWNNDLNQWASEYPITRRLISITIGLKNHIGKTNEYVSVFSYYPPVSNVPDGGGGIFYWTNDTTTADNGGTIIVPNEGVRTGCWKRAFHDFDMISVKWFGAKGDGTTDDTIAVQAAIDAGIDLMGYNIGKTIYFPTGTYIITSTILIQQAFGPHIVGERATLEWRGTYDADNPEPLLHLDSTQGTTIRCLNFNCRTGYRLAEGLRISTHAGMIISTKCYFEEIGISGWTDEIEVCVRFGTGIDANNDFHSFRNCMFVGYANCAVRIDNTSSQVYNVQFINCFIGGWGGSYRTVTGSIAAGSDILEHAGVFEKRHVGQRIEVPLARYLGGTQRGTKRMKILSIIDSTHCRLDGIAEWGDVVNTQIIYGSQHGIEGYTGSFSFIGGGLGGHLVSDVFVGGGNGAPVIIRDTTHEASRCLVSTAVGAAMKKGIQIESIRWSADSIDAYYPNAIEVKFGGNLVISNSHIGDTYSDGYVKLDYFCGDDTLSNFQLNNTLIGSRYSANELFPENKPTSIINSRRVGNTSMEWLGMPPNSLGNKSGAVSIDFGAARDSTLTATGDLNITLNYLPVGIGTRYRLHIVQGAGGPHAIRFVDIINWRNGIPQALNSPRGHAVGKVDVFEFWYDGTNIYGDAIGQMADAYMIQGKYITIDAPVDGYALTWNNGLSQWESSKPVPGGTAGGDLSGTYPNPTVDAIEGYAISPTQPVDGYALTWNNGLSKWEAGKPVPGGTAGGDLSGTYPKPTVDAIQGKAISTAIASVQGSSLSWDSGNQIFKDTSRAWAIGETQTDGIVLENTTPAIVTLDQHSPSLILSCRGWYTTSGASQKAKFRIYAHGNKEELGRPGNLGELKFSGWNDVTSTWTELLSFSNANTSGYICSFANTGIVSIPNFWCGSLRIQGSGTFIVGFDAPLDIQHIARTDGANNIVIKSNYDVNTASITNAATMRVHSFGWTNNSDVFTELAAVYCDGYVWGNQFSALGSNHNGLISMGVVPTGIANDYGIYTTTNTNTLSLWSTRSSGAGNISTAIVADVNAASINATHKVLQVGWVNDSNSFVELWNVLGDGSLNSNRAWAIGETQTDGIVLNNTTAATVDLDQFSPSLLFGGSYWNTTSGESSSLFGRFYLNPEKTTSALNSDVVFQGKDGVGGWTSRVSFPVAGSYGLRVLSGNHASFNTIHCGTGIRIGQGTVLGFGTVHEIGTEWNDTYPLGFNHAYFTESPSAICMFSCYDRNAASITNATTMRLHSFGWQDNVDTYHELAAVYCDGYVWGKQFSALGSDHNGLISMGVVPTGIASDYGIYTTNTANTLSMWSTKSSGAGNVSTAIVADVNSATIDPDHKVLQIGWVNNSNVFTELFSFKDSEISMNSSASAKILSSEADGGSVVAVTVGSDEKYETSGAKLLSVQNGTVDGYERANIDHTGDLCINKGNNSQSLNIKYLTELCTIADTADGYSTIQLPAESLIIGINVRVVTTIAGTSTFSLGVSGDYDYFATGVSSTSGVTKACLTNGIFYNASARSILITPNTTPSDAAGRLRITINYIDITLPNS